MISIIRLKSLSSLLSIYIAANNRNVYRSRITLNIYQNHTTFNRWLSSSSSQEFDEKTYEQIANKTLNDLNDRFEHFLDRIDDKNCDITFNVRRILLSNFH